MAPNTHLNLETLPNELVLHISSLLPSQHDRNTLVQCSKRLYAILNPELYHHDVRSGTCAALWHATDSADTRIAQLSLDAGAIINILKETVEGYFTTPFLKAIQHGSNFPNQEKVDAFLRFLLSRGADIHGSDSAGQTSLHLLCKSAQSSWTAPFFDLLLDSGADPTVPDNRGNTCLDLTPTPDIIRVFARRGLDFGHRVNRVLFLGIVWRDIELVKLALDSGADINHRLRPNPKYLVTPPACESPLKEDENLVPLLVALLFRRRFCESFTPECADIVRLLIHRGADLFARVEEFVGGVHPLNRDVEDWVPLYDGPLLHGVFKRVRCARECLEVFFEYGDGIDFNRRDDGGRTVFLAACGAGLQYYLGTVRESSESDSDSDSGNGRYSRRISDYNMRWETPEEERFDATGLFLRMLDFGADVTAVDNDGNNALVFIPLSRFSALLTCVSSTSSSLTTASGNVTSSLFSAAQNPTP